MKTALILGACGGFGTHMAAALEHKGYRIRVLIRNPAKRPQALKNAEIFKGDAANRDHVFRAASGAQLMVYAVNPANYAWDAVALPLLDVSASVAEELGMRLLFPGNVYGFDPKQNSLLRENTPVNAIHSKGAIRIAMEQRLEQASQRGAKVMVFRMGDFIGKGASSWMAHIIKAHKNAYKLLCTGPRQLKHSWAYLPDACACIVSLLEKPLADYEVFHYRGYRISFDDIAKAIESGSGQAVHMGKFQWLPIRLLKPFSALFKGLLEMRYLWELELNLCDDKLRATLGDLPRQTPLTQALLQSELLSPIQAQQQSKVA